MIDQVQQTNARRGIALLEVMIAVGILTFAVSAITSAIVAGQQHSLEAREKIIASIAAESLLSQLSQEPWETMNSWHGYIEDVGTISDPTGESLGGDSQWGSNNGGDLYNGLFSSTIIIIIFININHFLTL